MRLCVLASPNFAPLVDRLRSEAPDVELLVGHTPEELRDRIAAAEAIVLAPRYGSILVDLWRDLRNARWIHALGAGVDTLPFDLLRTSDIVVTNSRGVFADALGEFAIAAMLWFAKDLRRLVKNQEKRVWQPYTLQRLEGKSVGIIGYGGTGQAVGRRAAAFDMKVTGVRRRQEFGDPSIEEVLRESDYVVLTTPLTPSTRHLISRERLALMRPDAVFINLGRGPCVDEAALIEALEAKRIRGAALDVFEVEPLPASSRLWDLENVLLSPHTADHAPDSHDRSMTFFLENLARFRRGEPLENVVDKDEMY